MIDTVRRLLLRYARRRAAAVPVIPEIMEAVEPKISGKTIAARIPYGR